MAKKKPKTKAQAKNTQGKTEPEPADAPSKKDKKKKAVTLKRPAAADPPGHVNKKPAASSASWEAWANQGESEEEKEEEQQGGQNYETVTKAQRHVFDKAVRRPPDSYGGLPQEVYDHWMTTLQGPGLVQERQAYRNAIVPRNAQYSDIVNVNEAKLQMIRQIFIQKKSTKQQFGMTYSEMKARLGSEAALQEAMDKGDVYKKNNFYYFDRAIQEISVGGTQTWKDRNQQEPTPTGKNNIMEALQFAPWVTMAYSDESPCSLTAPANPTTMKRLTEASDAMRNACNQMQTLFLQAKELGITEEHTSKMTPSQLGKLGSLPNLLTQSISQVKAIKKKHLEAVEQVVYEEQGVSKQEVRDLLSRAAPDQALLMKQIEEVRLLMQKWKSAQKNKEE